jgi:hypothetical protein
MQFARRTLTFAGALALVVIAGAGRAGAQELASEFLAKPQGIQAPGTKAMHPPVVARCVGPINQVVDVGFEGLRTTPWNFAMAGGGGEGGRFDPTPVLSTVVALQAGTCINAHFSALVGSAQTYPGLAPVTLFQVTATNPNGVVQHLYGHYETPYGVYGPAVATEAERDVDEHASNFFHRVGNGPGEIPPGNYRIDVWWSGGGGAGGALGAAFVLKLYLN